MKLLTAYKSVSSSRDEEAMSELNQFIMHHSIASRKPTHYRVYGRKALDTIRAFLEIAGIESAFSVEASALDPEAFRIQWKDFTARALLVTQISSANPSVVSGAEALGLSDTDEGTPIVTDETSFIEPPDIVSASNAAYVQFLSRTPNYWDHAILTLHDAFQTVESDEVNPFVGGFGSSCFRYVSPDETVTPFGAAVVSPLHRTLFVDPEKYEGKDIIEGYMGFSIRDANEAIKYAYNRPCVAFVLSSEILWHTNAFAFCSDRRKLFTTIRDIYEKIYGCDGKYRVIIHPASRVAVDNRYAINADTSHSLNWVEPREYYCDIHLPVSLYVMGFIVPASMVSDTDPLRTMEKFASPVPTVKVVNSTSEIASENMFSENRITSSDIPAEWFAMTHLKSRSDKTTHNYVTDSVRNSNTVEAKAMYAKLMNNPSSAARACSVSKSSAFLISRNRNGISTGASVGAFVASVSGVLRIAFSKAGATSIPLKTARFSGKDPNRLHEKGAIATAVYSGVVTDQSKSLHQWIDGDGSDAFPAIPTDSSASDWTSFIERLPESGAMFRAAPITNGYFRFINIVETNVDYDAFMLAIKDKPETESLIRKAAVMFLAYRYYTPDNVICDNNPCCSIYFLEEQIKKESGGHSASEALCGIDPNNFAKFSDWTAGKDVIVAFHKDSYGRLYIVVELNGVHMLLARYFYRCYNGLNILSARYVSKHLAGPVTPKGTVLVNDTHGSMTRDEALRYAIELIKSPVGSTKDTEPITDFKGFWTAAYRYGGYISYGRETSLMTKEWYENAFHSSGIKGSVAALLRG